MYYFVCYSFADSEIYRRSIQQTRIHLNLFTMALYCYRIQTVPFNQFFFRAVSSGYENYVTSIYHIPSVVFKY